MKKIIIVIILLIIGYILFVIAQGGSPKELVSPKFNQIVTKSSPTPTPKPTPKTFQFDENTNLKMELEKINPKVEDTDFQ
jgi:hypothetical protein